MDAFDHTPQPAGEGTVVATHAGLDERAQVRARLARRVLRDALLLGASASALLHEGPGGIAFPLWVALLVATLVVLVRQRPDHLSREAGLWLATAVLFATLHATGDAELLSVLDVLATLAALILAGATLVGAELRSILVARVRDVLAAPFRAVGDAVTGIVPLALRDADWTSLGRRVSGPGLGAAARAALLTLPLLLVFGALFRSADPMFAALVRLPAIDVERVWSHLLIGGFFAWISAGWLRGIVVDAAAPRAERPLRLPALGRVEVFTVLGALGALFAAFVLVQLRWMFGGEGVVRATTGLGYAEYARRGFFELLWVAILTLPVLLGFDALVPRDDAPARRGFRVLGRVVLALLAVVVTSALGRMALYVGFYGLSLDRLYATAFMAWVAIVLAWLAVTVLRDRPRTFAAGMTISAPLVLLALHALRPDLLVARYNLARTTPVVASSTEYRERPVDLGYLAGLGAGAVPAVLPAVLRAPAATPEQARTRCEAARTMLRAWGTDAWVGAHHPALLRARRGEYDWRRWNPSRDRARETVRAREAELDATCAGVLPPASG